MTPFRSCRRLGAALLFVAAMLAAAGHAVRAGDSADREIIGFSADGGYFAFEEYGVQDGSGFPYSNVYVIDTSADRWVPGTPIRERIDHEDAGLAAVRERSRRRAAPVLGDLGIRFPGRLLVSNPVTELSAPPHSALFVVEAYMRMSDIRWEMILTELPLPEPEGCENLGPTKGFRLIANGPEEGETVLHEDKSIPGSRGCPQDYVLSDIIAYPPDAAPGVVVTLISVFSQGFEGPDRRFMAVTGRMPR